MASLIDAGTGYSTIADWSDTTPQPDSAASGASLEDPSTYSSFLTPSFALVNAETGYDTIADWFDTSPQPDFAASGASLAGPNESGYGILGGVDWELGSTGTRERWGVIGT